MTLIEELVKALEIVKAKMDTNEILVNDEAILETVDRAIERASALEVDQNRSLLIERLINASSQAHSIETYEEYGMNEYHIAGEPLPHREYNGRDKITIHFYGRRKLNGESKS